MRKRTKMQIAKLCIMSMAVSAFAGISMGNNAYADTWPDIGEAKIKSAQPHFSGYTVRNIETWDKTTDPYSDLMRARVPLQERNKAFTPTQANPELNDKTEIMLMQGDYGNSFFNSTIANNAYGNVAFNFWQYTDYFCPWHGAATIGTPDGLYDPATNHWRARGFEFGIVNIPNQAYINAAHKNGVKAIACIYFDPAFRPGQTINEMFVKDTNGEYVVAKKLVALAKEYGIDGYFLNNEERYDARFKDFMAYLSKQGLYTQFYNTNSRFDASKSQWLKDDQHDKIHDSVFVNYGWEHGSMDSYLAHAKEKDVDPYKAVFLGIESNQSGYSNRKSLPTKAYTSATNKNPLCSIALFTPSDMYQRGIDGIEKNFTSDNKLPVHQRDEFQWMIAERERMYFSGVTCDPKDTGSHADYKRKDVVIDDASYWPGVADFKAETSVIRGKKFYSTFNIGKGMQYFVNGKAVNDEAWTNLNDQDILPSWQWWFESEGDKLKADFDFGEKEVRNDVNGKKMELPFKQIGAYNGGSSLAVYGNLKAKNTLRLFKTALDVTDSTKAKLAFRKTSDDKAKMKLGLIFEDRTTKVEEVEIMGSETKSDEFKEVTVDLSKYKDKKIAAIGLVFEGEAEKYQMNIGSISISDTEAMIEAPENFKIDRIYADGQMVFSWKIDDYKDVDKYRIYAESEGVKHFLGGIFDEKLYVKDHFFEEDEEVKFSLVKVGKDGKESKAAEKKVDFSELPTELDIKEITPKGEFEVSTTDSNGQPQIQKKVISLPNEAQNKGKVEFSFKKAVKDAGKGYEAILEPIKDYTDDKADTHKIDVAGEDGAVNVDINDGYAYDLTIKSKGSDIGISYRGKFNDSYARPMTEDDVVAAGEKMIALRSPLTRDWYEVKVEFKKDGETTTEEVGKPRKRGVTRGYHNSFALPSDKGEIILTLKDYRGNTSELNLKYDETYKKELIELKKEYNKLVTDRAYARIIFDNDNLDNILDEMQVKLYEAENIINTLKRNEAGVTKLVEELKTIYAKLHKNENLVDYKFKLIVPGGGRVSFVLKDERDAEVSPNSEENNVYSFTLAKGKTYTYEIKSYGGYGILIKPVNGKITAEQDFTNEITLEKIPRSIKVIAKGDSIVKRGEKINKDDYEVELYYKYNDTEKLPLSDNKFTVEEPDTSTLGEKEVKVTGFDKEATFNITVVPGDSDPAVLKELLKEIEAAKELKKTAKYKNATKQELKDAFDSAIEAAEVLVAGSTFEEAKLTESLNNLKKAAEALDGVEKQIIKASPSSAADLYQTHTLNKMLDNDESTFAWFAAEQKVGDWVKLTYANYVKVSGVNIIYPNGVGEDHIRKADVEVKVGDKWQKIGAISGLNDTQVNLEEQNRPVTKEVRIKITESIKWWYKIAEFKVDCEAAEEPAPPEPDPEVKALKKALEEEIIKAEALREDIRYKNADDDKQDAFEDAIEAAKKIVKDSEEKEELKAAIERLKKTSEELNGKEENNTKPPVNPPIVYPAIPAVPSAPEKKEEAKPDTKQEAKSETKQENKTPSVTDITDTETPQGKAVERKTFMLPSSNGIIGLSALKGLNETNLKKVVLTQNKAKVNASITTTALSELVSKKVGKFEIIGKDCKIYLSAKNLKALNKLTKKQLQVKAVRLKTGKVKLQVLVDGKKLTKKQLAKLKIKVK